MCCAQILSLLGRGQGGLCGGCGEARGGWGSASGVQGSQELSLGCWLRSRPDSLDMVLEFCCPSSTAIFS